MLYLWQGRRCIAKKQLMQASMHGRTPGRAKITIPELRRQIFFQEVWRSLIFYFENFSDLKWNCFRKFKKTACFSLNLKTKFILRPCFCGHFVHPARTTHCAAVTAMHTKYCIFAEKNHIQTKCACVYEVCMNACVHSNVFYHFSQFDKWLE